MSAAMVMFVSFMGLLAVMSVGATVVTLKWLSYRECDCGCDDLREQIESVSGRG